MSLSVHNTDTQKNNRDEHHKMETRRNEQIHLVSSACWLLNKYLYKKISSSACILSIVKEITSPGGMHETSARAWCTGKTQRNRVDREVGVGSGWGIHVTPWLTHVNV